MGGFIDFGVDLIKGGMEKYGVTTNPVLIPGRVSGGGRHSERLLLYLPTAIFDFDVKPNKAGPQRADCGSAAKTS